MTARVGERRPVAVWAAGAAGLALAVASVLLPYAAYLTRPDTWSLVAGLAVLGSGWALVRTGATGPAGWLVLGAGCAWFVPALAVSGLPALDTAVRCTALVHISLLLHAVVVVGSKGVRGTVERLAVALGYAAAVTAVVGGYQAALPVAGLGVTLAVLRTGSRLPSAVRALRTAAGLVLGLGLIADAVVRALVGVPAESWAAIGHPGGFAAAAVLVALAGTRRTVWGSIDVASDGMAQLESAVAAEVGARSLGIALSDGEGGWLRPTGESRGAPVAGGYAVLGLTGTPCAVLEGPLEPPLPSGVEALLRLAAANARLRRSMAGQVDELEVSRRRLLSAADSERAALGAQLRVRAVAHVAAMERELARSTLLEPARHRAMATRRALEIIARGIDPMGHGRTLRGALDEVATTALCEVLIDHCDEPASQDVARALWFCTAEAAANTSKHAGDAALHVAIRRGGSTMHATLSDDGPGGADPRGAGLRGLADRVETLGGSLQVASPVYVGTTLEIALPDVREDCGQPQGELAGDPDSLAAMATYRRSHRLLGGTS